MKNNEIDQDDELRKEYDLNNLRIRKFGPERTRLPQHGVILEPDVAAFFPDSDAVNEALRFLVRVTKENTASPTQP